jgi:hypothetical protein
MMSAASCRSMSTMRLRVLRLLWSCAPGKTPSGVEVRKPLSRLIGRILPHDQNRMRGHGALLAACDTTLRIEGGTLRTATIEKTNDGAEGERIAFAIESVELGRVDRK